MEITCIRCPIGCHLNITKDKSGEIIVTGNNCPRGAEYGKQEMTMPMRTITSVKKTENGTISLRSNTDIPKEKYFDILKEIKNAPLKKNYNVGDILIKNVCGTNANIVVTGVHKGN